MKHKRFFSVKGPLFAWAVVNFDNRASEESACDFINKFIENLKALGMWSYPSSTHLADSQ